MMKQRLCSQQVEAARRFLEELGAPLARTDDSELKSALAKRAELQAEAEAIQRDGQQPLDEAASRLAFLRAALDILGGRIVALERSWNQAEKDVASRRAATRQAAIELVMVALQEYKADAESAVESLLRPWYRDQAVGEKTLANIPFVVAITDCIAGMAKYGLGDEELLARLREIGEGGNFLGLIWPVAGEPARTGEL
jgi:hypothetical protein